MGKREGNRLLGLSLLLAGIVFLLIFVVLSLRAWKNYFQVKPKEWNSITRKEKDVEEKESLAHLPAKNILFLSSYDSYDPVYQKQLEGLEDVFQDTKVHLDSLNLHLYQSKAAETEDAFLAMMQSYLAKKALPYDGILLGDDRSLELAMQFKDSLFPDIPMIFFSVHNMVLAKSAEQNSLVSGFYCLPNLEDTVVAATKLQDKAKSIIAIYDGSYFGTAARDDFQSVQRNFPDYRFAGIDLSQLDKEQFLQSLKDIGKESILIYMNASEDKDGNIYPKKQMEKLILKEVNTPVYGYFMDENYPGFIGGRVFDYRSMAEEAARLLGSVLSGKVEISKEPMKEDSHSELLFSKRILSAYHLSLKRLPKDAVLDDGISDLWTEYREIILIVLLPFWVLFLFSLAFLFSRMRSKKLFRILEEENDHLAVEQDQLSHRLRYDYLTELLNRQTALSSMEELLKGHTDFSCVLVDIDNLKELNELRGYETGDLYLSAVANRLKLMEKEYGAVASRYGGDEFLIIFPGAILQSNSLEVGEIQSAFYRSITVSEETVYMKASGGIAYSHGNENPKEVVLSAGIALAAAKSKGKNHFVFYTDELRYKKEKINQILNMVEKAIQENAFYMVYQPQVECKSRKIVGFESLLRIRNEVCSPDQFIPVAEQYGYITKLGKIAVEQVVRQLARWKDEGRDLCPISINFSSYQIYDDDFVDFLLYQLERYGIPTRYVVLEITESILFEESKQTKSVFRRLVDAGIELHLDDFGTGYSSFAYLPYIPLNTVKMDKSIVDHFLSANGDVVRNLISIVHDLGMVVIVEGVEEEWQYEKLNEYGCDIIQGYLFGGPVLATEIN